MIGSSRRSSSSTASSVVTVPQPSRDLSFRKGAYTKNILRLEQSAEAMSADGSDIGEEIRKMNEAERRNSIMSDNQGDELPRRKSQTVSIVGVNNNARAGGYSPGGFVTSPTGSIHSGSWSRPSMHRRISSGGKSSKFTSMMPPSFEDKPLELTLSFEPPERQLSQISFDRGDDGAATHIRDERVGSPDTIASSILRPSSVIEGASTWDRIQEHRRSILSLGQDTALADIHTPTTNNLLDLEQKPTSPPPRPSSTDTFQQAQVAFKDFDGVHFSPDPEEAESRRTSKRLSSATLLSARPTSMMPIAEQMVAEPTRMSTIAPAPNDGMVYYPAPVPRMLNLPKRMSQLPPASAQMRRRSSQPLTALSPAARNSAAWLGQSMGNGIEEEVEDLQAEEPKPNRRSLARMSTAPEQLRASNYFEHPAIKQEVELKGESAVATLDSILAASATLPASAFTDHPYAGDISKTAFAPERLARRSTAGDLRQSIAGPPLAKTRTSSFGNLLRRASSGNMLETIQDENRMSQPRLNARASQMSLGNTIVTHDQEEEEEEEDGLTHRPTTRIISEGDMIAQDFKDEEELEDVEDDDIEAMFAQPSTLLAELQVRKAQLKSRNRTAATAFPRGMHSTLLELDAVAQIDKKKRAHQRIALAWEDPNLRVEDAEHDAEDDDVPLGVMFPNKTGGQHRKMGDVGDWDRPLGLMEKRQMEDNEPLSSRRSRLRGEPIRPVRRAAPAINLPVKEDDAVEGDDEDLAYRAKRMSTKSALDAAISDVTPKDGSRPLSTFTDEIMGQLNLETKETEAAPPTKEDLENETLGQRRARLQREREAEGSRPVLQSKNSMSTLLANNPVGMRKTSRNHTPARGTLLFASEQAQADHKRNMLNSNMRSSSFVQTQPQAPPPLTHSQSMASFNNAGMLAQQNSWAVHGGFAGGMYNNAMGGAMQSSMSTPMFQQNGYFAQNPGMGGYFGQMPQQSGINPLAYGMLTGQQPVQQMMYPHHMQAGVMGYGQNMMPLGMDGQPITHQQRAAIDQWRMSVAR